MYNKKYNDYSFIVGVKVILTPKDYDARTWTSYGVLLQEKVE
ncbi:MAG TPA: hypothetical protein VFC05_04360 [Nitrososphaeraceae archaeon]|jgi:hypothetical protein|nr:hypothetical protein [Nitrososphaeraceae archaeon]